MSGRGGDRGSAGRGAKRKGPPRVSAGGGNAETYVETGAQAMTVPAELEELYVDERLPKKGKGKEKNGKNGKHASAKPANGKAAAPVEKAPSSSSAKKKGHRASERRRARGDVPIGPEAGTSTALNQKQQNARGGESGHLRYATGVLTCVKGPEEGLALNLLEGSYTVGRGRDNSFVLKDIASSRHHLRIDVEGGRVTVSDMGSGNGTRLNGKTTQMFVLEEGDRVELGNSVLVFSRIGGKGAGSLSVSDPHVDEAQARIERAAQKLTAELGDRFRDPGDDSEDPDAAPTATGRPRTKGRRDDDDELSRRKTRPPMPDELWNDALTHVPLSEVVPADSPLGPKETSGPPRKARPTPASERSPALAPPTPARDPPRAPPRAPPPPPDFRFDDEPPAPPTPSPARSSRPAPLPPGPPTTTPPQRASRQPHRSAPYAYGVIADKQAPPAWTYVVLPALVVVLILGTALGGWALYRYVKGSGGIPTSAATTQHEESVRLALRALADNDIAAARQHAERAYELRPDDVTVVELLKSIQDRQQQDSEQAAPNNAAAAGSEAIAAPTPETKPEPREAPQEAAQEEAAPVAAAEPVIEEQQEPAAVTEPPKPAPAVQKQATVRKAAAKPKAKPKARQQRRPRQQSKQMSDDQAGDIYRQAVRLVRDEDEARGCSLLRKVAKEAPASSNWKVKASAAVGRYGCD